MDSKKVIAALDIGSSQIRSVLAISDGSENIQVIGYASEPCSNILNKGFIVNNDLVAKLISTVVEKAELMAGREVDRFCVNISSFHSEGIYSNGVIAVENSREVDIYDIDRVMQISQSVPISSDKEIIHNIPLSFSIDGMKVDEPVGANGVRLEAKVYLITSLISAKENLEKIINKNGYEIAEYIHESLAAAEVTLTAEEKKNGAVVINLGYDKTNVAYYKNNSATFITKIDLGSHHVTKDLAYGLKTSEEIAEGIKKKYGVALESQIIDDEMIKVKLLSYQKVTKISKRVISRIIEARLEEILLLVKESLNKTENFDGLNNVMVITGGGAIMPGLDDLVNKIFNEPCRVGTPFNLTGIENEVNSPEYVTVLGLIKYVILGNISEDLEAEKNPVVSRKPMSKFKKALKKFFT